MDKKIEIPREKVRESIVGRVDGLKQARAIVDGKNYFGDIDRALSVGEESGRNLLKTIDEIKGELPMTLLALCAAWILSTDKFIESTIENLRGVIISGQQSEIAEHELNVPRTSIIN